MTRDPQGAYDVAIVGFGPVGQLLSLLLSGKGHSVLVLERWPEPYELPRAVTFDDEIGRIFQAAGVGEQVRAISDPVPDHYEWRNRDGDTLLRIDWSGTGPSGWPTANFFSQPELEAVLTAAIAEQPTATVRRGQEVLGLRQGSEHVELTTRGGETFRARYAIGADGANSFARSRMRTTVTDLGFFYDWLIVDIVPRDTDTRWSPMNWQLCDPERPTTLVSGGPGRRRWEFMRLPGESVENLNTLDTAWKLLRPWGRNPGNTVIERHAVYTFQARWADVWREGRLLLAGDAAHQMPPFAGQGMCSGLRDAINLAWKLDLVLTGTSAPALLDTYTTERRGHVQHAIGMSMALGRIICVPDEAAAAERDARMIATGADPARALPPTPPPVLGDGVLQQAPNGAPRPDVGRLTPQYRISHNGRTDLLDALTGGGFIVLTDGEAPCTALGTMEREFLDRIDATLVPLHSPGSPDTVYADVDDAYLPHLRKHAHIAAVIRPDFYLFGAAATPSELRGLITQLKERIHLLPNAPHRAPPTPASDGASRHF
ncbi:bifunctional 3-(3-hydroxy-phenyl)propionate/3-hydroxycinnamic acid hydroxylase MhpA [Streptomyces pinistramenti]|uniref:bifunctional 3-(3-hydroxy-phenyl)propionate/3-hydroxycinnamic acid hydroxylase MhpA n=1 Tax=Streptomyces pinistramenti TaxID=2884812 RepID=UPI001D088D70|nr:bifunctional 3-(3-hydroxy-phenyl)propionate/3-hydroxycinnamic acid hydroxylase [Streptomyces pinistramenti]MCB5907376.1 bifunctional 3-(3-hydroxy-phenyl)propionate/3-hydroxycinnamic acid hydroxylase [Streptomyces pinistramenti]